MYYFTVNEIDEKIKKYEANIRENNKLMLAISEKFLKQYKEMNLLQKKLADLKTEEEELRHPWRTLGKKIFKGFPCICIISCTYIFVFRVIYLSVINNRLSALFAVLLGITLGHLTTEVIDLANKSDIKKSCDVLFCRVTELKEVGQSIKITENKIKCVENEQIDLRAKFKDLNCENDILYGNVRDLYEKKKKILSRKNEAVSRFMNHPVIQKFQKQLEEYHNKMNELTSLKENYVEQLLNQKYEKNHIGQKFGIHLDLQQK